MDFTTVEVWTRGGLVTYYVAFVMELATRKVVCAGITPHPGGEWMLQIGRNLTDAISGFLRERRSSAFLGLLQQSGIRPVRTPPSAPNCNAHLEHFNGSFKREAAERVIFFGESQPDSRATCQPRAKFVRSIKRSRTLMPFQMSR